VKNKVKEMTKKENEEKDSLFEKIKSQAAMEYLMTYGWAILIIALTLAVLYSLGIMNPKNFLPRAPPGSCFVFRPNGPGTTDFVSLQGTCGYLPMYVASFNGVSGYINIPNSASLNPTNAVTVVAWFKTNVVHDGAIVWKAYSTYGPTYGFAYFGASYNGIAGRITNTSGNYYTISFTWAPDGKWHHLVMSYNGSAIKLYFDGVTKTSATLTGAIITSTYGVIIGNRETANMYFNGQISNVQVYSTALTSQEIQYLYQQGLGGGPIRLQNLVGWWPLNGDAKDYSGNNNHGTINGGVTFVQNYNPP
jgi:hypothetical protein